MRFLPSLLILSVLLALSGCASLAPPETDALAKLMRPVEGKAIIYVFRNEEYSAPWHIGLSLDGKSMGSTQANTYVRWSVEPGQHIIVSHRENDAPLVLRTEPGKVYYVWQDVSMGFFRPRSDLRLVDRTTAEIALRTCYLLRS
jgi:uncharacterized protein DUF2846